MNRTRLITLGTLASALSLAGGYGMRAAAEGAPTTQPLFYSGTLEDGGRLAEGEYAISLGFHDAERDGDELCRSESPEVRVEAGRFRVLVDESCVAMLQANPDVWLSARVTGAGDEAHDIPRIKIGAVPYAMEAQHAVSADVARNTPFVTAWEEYTPQVTAGGVDVSSSVDPTNSGAFFRRVGDTLEVRIGTWFTSCPEEVGALNWSLPESLRADGSKLAWVDAIGSGLAYGANGVDTNLRTVTIVLQGGRHGGDTHLVALDAAGLPAGGEACGLVGPGGSIRFSFSVPIEGWTVTE